MGGPVFWNVKRQTTVALSSCEAEYCALSRTIQEAFWWKHFQSQLFAANVITIRCDNQSAICVAQNQGYIPRTKHLDIRYHFVKDALNQGAIEVNFIGTNEQPADGLTKALMKNKLQAFKQSLRRRHSAASK